jgi:hypothetical protein
LNPSDDVFAATSITTNMKNRLLPQIAKFSLFGLMLSCMVSCQTNMEGVAYSAAAGVRKAAGQASESAPAYRSGLGTKLGGERYSSVTNTTFYRKSLGSPDAVDSFHYNDEAGAIAMLGGDKSATQRHSGRFNLANNTLSVALVGGYDDDAFPSLTSKKAPGRTVVVGTSGSTYEISIENKTKKRVEVVASVDGLDVLDGGAASVKKHGHILEPGQRMAISGLRKNSNQVRAFTFGTVSESAAAKKGESAARNVGVIGLAVWHEDEAAAKQAAQLEANRRSEANPFGGSPVSLR